MSTIHNGRFNVLQIAYTDLMNASNRSPFIEVTPVDAMDGWPAEKYIVTFSCKGIARLFQDGSPEYSEHHEMKLELSSRFPANEPSLLWITDIWHPNIGHKTRHVCTNEISTWYPQKSLLDFVVNIGEMVQYKHYFAQTEPPFPEDPEVAKWVREVAEPGGWVGPGKPVDDRPMLKQQKIRKAVAGGAPIKEGLARPRIIFKVKYVAAEPSPTAERGCRIILGNRSSGMTR